MPNCDASSSINSRNRCQALRSAIIVCSMCRTPHKRPASRLDVSKVFGCSDGGELSARIAARAACKGGDEARFNGTNTRAKHKPLGNAAPSGEGSSWRTHPPAPQNFECRATVQTHMCLYTGINSRPSRGIFVRVANDCDPFIKTNLATKQRYLFRRRDHNAH